MRISLGLLLGLGLLSAPAAAQTGLSDPPQVHGVRIEIVGDADIRDRALRGAIATRGRGGLIAVRRALSWVPFVPAVADRPLQPLELQRDKERLRRVLVRRGYPQTVVDYDVRPAEDAGAVDVVFRVEPGAPLLLEELAIAWSDPSTAQGLDPEAALAAIRPEHDLLLGEPLDSSRIAPAATALARWLGNRGYAFARVETEVRTDSLLHDARVLLIADPGPVTRIGSVETRGIRQLREPTVRHFRGVDVGDPFSLAQLQDASQRLSALDLVRQASFQVPRGQPADSTVNLVLQIREEPLREVSADAGYASDGGLSGETRWTHRSILGGAQTLSATVAGYTGIWALEENPEKFVRGTLSLRQPVAGRAALVLDVAPFIGYRNDYRDRSLEYGFQATLVQRLGPLSSVALQYELSTRRVYEYRFGDFSAGIDFFELAQLTAEGVLDSLGARIGRSTLSLSGSFGALDVATQPRRGWVVEPSVTVTAPGGLTSIQYAAANVRASAYLPVSDGLTIAARMGAGRLFPYGKSIPPTQDQGLREYFRLRDVLFTVGGMDDVRGWGEGLLGPKFPQATFSVIGDTALVAEASRFTPIGGFNRFHATVEARTGLPFLGDAWGGHVFLDAGRVWTVDERFTDSADPLGVESLFWAAGGGIDYSTPIGALRLAVGYKLNPSILDLATPQGVIDAIVEDRPLETLPRHPWQRIHIHVGLGTRL